MGRVFLFDVGNDKLGCMWQLVRCGMQNTVSLRGGPLGPTWQSPGTTMQLAMQACQGQAPKCAFVCNIFGNEDLTRRLPRRCAPRNDMVVFTWLRRFEQSDKLKFEPPCKKTAPGIPVPLCAEILLVFQIFQMLFQHQVDVLG